MNSGTSLPHSGSRQHLDFAASTKMEDSTAAMNRQPMRIPGLSVFLRKEYYRRLGVYINRARDEHKKLHEFWKDYVSEMYKEAREKKLQLIKMNDPYATPKPSVSAVPALGAAKSELEREYEKFKNAFELDVVVTLDKDLEEEAQNEK